MGELAKVEEADYMVFERDPAQLTDLIQANLGDGSAQVTPFDLQRIAIPAGGGQRWSVPTPEGEESLAEIECIIAAWHDCRAYWPGEFTGGEPPQCTSPDAKAGIGDPGGECTSCAYAQFGSAANGEGQACKAMRRLFLLRPGMVLPYLLTLPPTGLKPCRHYFVGKLLTAGLAYWSVVTAIGLDRATSGTGIAYSVPTFRMVRQLTPEQTERVKAYSSALDPFMTTPVTTDDYVAGESGIDL